MQRISRAFLILARRSIGRAGVAWAAVTAMLVFVPAALAVGPDGANHTDRATAYGPLAPGVAYSGYNAYAGDIDVYSVRDYVDNGNLTVNVQDDYSGGDDECEFFTACDLQVGVYGPDGSEIDPGGFCAEPGSPTVFPPVTLPRPGLYYIAVQTNSNNITCGLGPISEGQTIPYALSFKPSFGVGSQACQVPSLPKGSSLATAKRAITGNECAIGKITRRHSSVAKGRVLALSPKSGAYAPGKPISIRISSGPQHQHHH